MNDEVTFSGTGEMDNGWNITVSMQLDNNAGLTVVLSLVWITEA